MNVFGLLPQTLLSRERIAQSLDGKTVRLKLARDDNRFMLIAFDLDGRYWILAEWEAA